VIGACCHLSLFQPIGPGEELLVRYSVQDNPEITAALEEERVSSLSKKISPELNEVRPPFCQYGTLFGFCYERVAMLEVAMLNHKE
jgi:hypothetical protein